MVRLEREAVPLLTSFKHIGSRYHQAKKGRIYVEPVIKALDVTRYLVPQKKTGYSWRDRISLPCSYFANMTVKATFMPLSGSND